MAGNRARLALFGACAMTATLALGFTFALADEPAPPAAKARSWGVSPIALSEMEIPSKESERPSPTEWRDAKRFEPTRVSQAGRQCRAYLVREWLKVHCDQQLAEIQQLAGTSKSAFVWVNSGKTFDHLDEHRGGEVIFRVEKASLSVFELRKLTFDDYSGPSAQSLVIVEASWLSHEPMPRVIIR